MQCTLAACLTQRRGFSHNIVMIFRTSHVANSHAQCAMLSALILPKLCAERKRLPKRKNQYLDSQRPTIILASICMIVFVQSKKTFLDASKFVAWHFASLLSEPLFAGSWFPVNTSGFPVHTNYRFVVGRVIVLSEDRRQWRRRPATLRSSLIVIVNIQHIHICAYAKHLCCPYILPYFLHSNDGIDIKSNVLGHT